MRYSRLPGSEAQVHGAERGFKLDDGEGGSLGGTNGGQKSTMMRWKEGRVWQIVVVFAISCLLLSSRLFARKPLQEVSKCSTPSMRKEWRDLAADEKADYIRAVRCMSTIPSKSHKNATMHDEFALVHMFVGDDTHEAAMFVPWHRYFINIYEQRLREQCLYSGHLPFWDWTLDAKDLTKSPLWSAVDGFGSNGNTSTPMTVGDGYCVEDGPFSNLQAQYYEKEHKPHCLSRGFIREGLAQRVISKDINSTAIEYILKEPDYYTWLLKLEDGPHSAIPKTVRGDFTTFTAPNDPIFFLHHAQVDRLWWQWQSRDLKTRVTAYNGPSKRNSTKKAALTDMIDLYQLAPSVPVSSMMNIQSGPLCYDYAS